MWLFNKPPVDAVRDAYGFEITPEWLNHLQRASVRFGGGSGSFVSPNGLILTNHHVGAGTIERLGSAENDLLKNGFLAASHDEELPCPGMEINVLMAIDDVTARVHAAVTPEMDTSRAVSARRAVIAEIERTATEASGLKCEVVTLHRGGLYHLYHYRRFTDVRLVFAPDARAAAFGGDPDNFEYPRHCLDFAFFRAWHDGKPAATPDFLKWNAAGAEPGELTFVSGHPGRTNRSMTLAQIEDMRDHRFPQQLERTYRTEAILRAWSDRDVENARRAKQSIVGTQNGRKASQARLDGLLDPAFMASRAAAEETLRQRLRADPRWQSADAAFDEIAAALDSDSPRALRERMLEGGEGFGTRLFGTARTLVRAAAEAPTPNGERLPEFRDSSRTSLEHRLFSEEPFHQDLEILRLTDSLTILCAKLGVTDPLVAKILDGKPPATRAADLIRGSRLTDPAERRKLYDGGQAAIDASQDPMILLARLIDAEARALRATSEEASEIIAQAHQRIAEARFAIEGDSVYPDATFSLRLSFGVIHGYPDPDGVPPFTTFGSMMQRHQHQGGLPPYDLSDEWHANAAALNPGTRLNFVSTHDITGGNSGSLVVNRNGELVGLIFDTNSHGLVSDFGFNATRGRAVSVHPAAMTEVLRHIHRATHLLTELGQ